MKNNKNKIRLNTCYLALSLLTCLTNNSHANEAQLAINSTAISSSELSIFSQNLEESLCDQSLKDGENDVANTILQPTVECKDAGSWLNVVVAVILWLIPKRTS